MLPEGLDELRFRLRFRPHPEVGLAVTRDGLTLSADAGRRTVLPLHVRDTAHRLDLTGRLQVPLPRRPGGRS